MGSGSPLSGKSQTMRPGSRASTAWCQDLSGSASVLCSVKALRRRLVSASRCTCRIAVAGIGIRTRSGKSEAAAGDGASGLCELVLEPRPRGCADAAQTPVVVQLERVAVTSRSSRPRLQFNIARQRPELTPTRYAA